MLVLSRKRGETVVLPQCAISVTVIKVQGQAVRLGISAPPEVAVHRDEVWRRQCEEGFGEAEEAAALDCRDELAAEFTHAAYQTAIRHGLADSWLELELGLWKAMAGAIKTACLTSSREEPAAAAPIDAEEMAHS